MNNLVALFLACILAGFALIKLPVISFLASLSSLFTIIGVLSVIIFSLVLIFMGVKALFKEM